MLFKFNTSTQLNQPPNLIKNINISKNQIYHHGVLKTIKNHPILILFCLICACISPLSFRQLDQIWSKHKGVDILTKNTVYDLVIYLFIGIVFSIFARGLMCQLLELSIESDIKIAIMNNLLTCNQETIEKYNNNFTKLYESPKIIAEIISQSLNICSALISIGLSIYDLYGNENFKRIIISFILTNILIVLALISIKKIFTTSDQDKLSELSIKINNFQQDNINNSIIIKINGAEKIRHNQYKKYIKEFAHLSKKIWFINMISIIMPIIIVPCGLIASYHFTNNMSLTQFRHSAMLNRYIGDIASAIPKIFTANGDLQKNNYMISDMNFEEQKNNNGKSIDKIKSIEVKNLNFTIGVKNLRGSFKINSKDSVALVGKSGAGKTTLLKLLMGTIVNKSIIINKSSMNNINIKDYRKNITYIHQIPLLFNDTIEKNLSITGNNNLKQYDEIAKSVGLYNRIYNNPLNYNQSISNFSLSGGEKQRLSMMMCLLKSQYSLVILDEPTSNLDYFNKKLFDNLVKKLFYKKTMLLWIDHNRDIVDIVDYIIFIDENGQIHYDSHVNLLKNNKEYNNYFTGTDVDYNDNSEIIEKY